MMEVLLIIFGLGIFFIVAAVIYWLIRVKMTLQDEEIVENDYNQIPPGF